MFGGCRPAKIAHHYDEDRWKYRQHLTMPVAFKDTAYRLYRVLVTEKPKVVYYSGLSFIQVTAQLAGAYDKMYLKFEHGIDTSERGSLGGGTTSVEAPLAEVLYYVTRETRYNVYAHRDTLVIAIKPAGT